MNTKSTWFGLVHRNASDNDGIGAMAGFLKEIDFYKALHIERARADRTGLPLSMLILWEIDDGNGSDFKREHLLPALAEILVERIRCTDIVGQFEDRKISALLPHTSGEAVWALLKDVHNRLVELYGEENVTDRIFYRVHTTDADGDFLDDELLTE